MTSTLLASFAPTGRLRASINLGNPILANIDPRTSQPVGISVDLAHALAERLGVDVELVVFDTASKSVEALRTEQADIGFFAVDPLRGQEISFTQPYVLIEGSYLVREDSPLQSNEEVDREGIRVTVGKGSAYDLYLSRELKHAQIERAGSSQMVVDTFMAQHYEVAAGVKQQLQADAQRVPGLRLLPGRFMVIGQAMGTPKSRGEKAASYLQAFVLEMGSTGFVTAALKRHGIELTAA
jgi:polar amino acid transport system substrate-binding protein